MSKILHDLPFKSTPEFFDCHPLGTQVPIKSYQLPVRIRLGINDRKRNFYLPVGISFPAVLDTGFNKGLALNETDLWRWVRIKPEELGKRVPPPPNEEKWEVRGVEAHVFESRFYVWPNRPGTWDADDRPLHPIVTQVFVFSDPNAIRLPLIGMAALEQIGGTLTVDFAKSHANL